ncbi:hypothetical protein [Brevibacillus centrosporus]|uniref:hypothetical protein n=1 Tax=Brevibacillus centrosporus TaxID=54910 RepID=UPI00381D71E2
MNLDLCTGIDARGGTIENADLILVIHLGEIIESGTHEELLQKKGFYFEMYHSQFAHLQNVSAQEAVES